MLVVSTLFRGIATLECISGFAGPEVGCGVDR